MAPRSAPSGTSHSSPGRPTKSLSIPKNNTRTRMRAANFQSNRRVQRSFRCTGLQCDFRMPVTSQSRLRVRYAETDQIGIVYYANYLVWMDVGRVDLCKACGFNYSDMERDDGILLAVAEANCRYSAPARFDD